MVSGSNGQLGSDGPQQMRRPIKKCQAGRVCGSRLHFNDSQLGARELHDLFPFDALGGGKGGGLLRR